MSEDPKKIRPGEVLPFIDAASWNAFCDTTTEARAKRGPKGGVGSTSSVRRIEVEVQNTTGSLIDAAFPILVLGDPVFTFTDNSNEIHNAPVFKGTTPDTDTDIGQIGIVLGPIGDTQFRAAVIQGPAYCEVDVTDSGHTHAAPKDGDNTKLASGTSGARIFWKESGTGTKKAVVILGGGGGGGGTVKRGMAKATADIGPASGDTPTTSTSFTVLKGDDPGTLYNYAAVLIKSGQKMPWMDVDGESEIINAFC